MTVIPIRSEEDRFFADARSDYMSSMKALVDGLAGLNRDQISDFADGMVEKLRRHHRSGMSVNEVASDRLLDLEILDSVRELVVSAAPHRAVA